MAKKNFTWNELAKAISKLPEKERRKPAIIQIEDESALRHITGLTAIQKDVYVNKEDNEDAGELEGLKYVHEDFDIKDYRVATPKGTPFLWIDF